jgi:hypothetical protein
MGRVKRDDIQISYTDEYWFGDLLNKGNKMMLITMDTIEKERKARLQDVREMKWPFPLTSGIIGDRREMERLTALIKDSEGKFDEASMSTLYKRRIVLRERIGE